MFLLFINISLFMFLLLLLLLLKLYIFIRPSTVVFMEEKQRALWDVTQPDGAAQRYNVVLQRLGQSAATWTNSLKISAIFFLYFFYVFFPQCDQFNLLINIKIYTIKKNT